MSLQQGKLQLSPRLDPDVATVDVSLGLSPVLLARTFGPPRLDRMNATNEWIGNQLRRARLEGSRLAVVLDVSGRRSRPTPEQQRSMANWLTTNRELIEQSCVAWSMVVTSPILRGVLTAITWFAPFPCPMKVHASIDIGAAWCVDMLVSQRVPVSALLRDATARRALIASIDFETLP
jgi:hypothetical protein